ncbi:MAG: hypothetical protein Q7O66_11725 [Dehalococcoidia bacterium]|nr:hypothetical protein [Dehalococcoidia bacterium]
MTRLQELEKKYPGVPREFILKWDVLNRGVRDSEDLDKVSEFQQFHFSYQSYDHDVTLKELVEKRPEKRLKGGRVLRPVAFNTKNGFGADLRISTRSPYEVRDIGDGRFALFEGEEEVDVDIYFPPPEPSGEEEALTTSKGTPISRLIERVGARLAIFPQSVCEYFPTGDQSKFCNFNATQEDSRAAGAVRPVAESLEEIVEAYKILSSKFTVNRVGLEVGNFARGTEERLQVEFLDTIAKAASYKPNFKIYTSALPRKSLERLKDVGVDCISIQMEVWDRNLFAEIVPGKAKRMPHEGWLEAIVNAVDIFGPGNVGVKVISGLTLIPENGHKTWQEAVASHIEGNRWLIKNGAFPNSSHLRLPPGSVYGAVPSLREKLPPTEYYLEMAQAHHADMMESRFFERNLPEERLYVYATNLAGAVYLGELTIWALAGNPDHWMAGVVQAQMNRVARFVPAVESRAQATTGGQSDC